jgi:hypothetical protein
LVKIPIFDVKWKKALNSGYLLFYSDKADDEHKAGIYCAKIDFSLVGRKETDKLLKFISENMVLIEELDPPKELRVWDVEGNAHVLAVAYSILGEDNKTTSKLMVLTSEGGTFTECDNADHSDTKVNAIKVIVPFEDKDLAYVVYGLAKGLDASGH